MHFDAIEDRMIGQGRDVYAGLILIVTTANDAGIAQIDLRQGLIRLTADQNVTAQNRDTGQIHRTGLDVIADRIPIAALQFSTGL